MHIARRLHIGLFLGLLISLAPLLVEAQVVPDSKERVRKEQVQEVERYLEHVERGDRTVNYVLSVVLPVLGLIGVLVVLRRSFID